MVTNTCVICFDPIKNNKCECKNKNWKCKNCEAVIHKKCIHQWKITNPNYPYFYTCPLCKKEYKIYNYTCIIRLIKKNSFAIGILTILLLGIIILCVYTIGIIIMFIFLFR